MDKPSESNTDKDTKMLGAQIPADIYWTFKACAGKRKERMEEAVRNAALLYIDADKAEIGKEAE